MPNVNIELFKRTSPERKIELIRKLTQAELSGISESTLLRIVKETGRRIKGSRNYEFYVNPDRREGNNWNSMVEGVWLYRGKLHVMVYVQLDYVYDEEEKGEVLRAICLEYIHTKYKEKLNPIYQQFKQQ